MLECNHELIHVGMPLATERPALGDTILDIQYQPPRVLGGRQHVVGEGQEPLHVAIRMYPTVGTSIRIGRAGEPQVNRRSREVSPSVGQNVLPALIWDAAIIEASRAKALAVCSYWPRRAASPRRGDAT